MAVFNGIANDAVDVRIQGAAISSLTREAKSISRSISSKS